MHALIEADGLSKRFGKVQALSELSLTLPPGQPVAILGPNGAGKTTFVRMVATLLQPDRGTLAVAGHDVVRQPMSVRRLIGLAGQSAAVEEMMTGRENLMMFARLYGQERKAAAASARRILAQMHLEDAADRQVRTYSGGMRRRLDLGASLVGTPRLLLLDEPTTGLDPGSRNEVWDAIREMNRAGTDILLTTQYLDEADHLAASIVIIDDGPGHCPGHTRPAQVACRSGHDRTAYRRRAHPGASSPGARHPGRGGTGHRPGYPALLVGRACRRQAAARCHPGPRRRGGGRGGHLAAPADARRGLPGPDGAHHRPLAPDPTAAKEDAA